MISVFIHPIEPFLEIYYMVDSRAMSLRDAYWNAVNKEEPYELPRRPTYAEIAEHIKVTTNGTRGW